MSQPIRRSKNKFTENVYPVIMACISLVAIIATFGLASSASEVVSKSKGFSAIIVAYLVTAIVVHYLSNRPGSETAIPVSTREPNTDERLFAIEEASQFFGGKLKSEDMFRLVANKVNEILPFTACVLHLVDRSTDCIRIVQATGENAEKLRNLESVLDAGLAGRCIATELAQIDRGMLTTKESLPAEAIMGFRSSAAVPLIRSGEVFAIFQLYSDSRTAFDGNSITILEAIAERITPMILSSISFERSVSTALTDPVTDLPNERAFQLVLENQIAETQRRPMERPLAILAIDIKNFYEMNSRFGHASGDRMLGSIAQVIKSQLRQMDFFARASNDEFLAILPTANEEIAAEVIARIINGISTSSFFVNEAESIKPELYFGTASFGKHGETAELLMLTARLQKQQAKANAPTKVIWFPNQSVS